MHKIFKFVVLAKKLEYLDKLGQNMCRKDQISRFWTALCIDFKFLLIVFFLIEFIDKLFKIKGNAPLIISSQRHIYPNSIV